MASLTLKPAFVLAPDAPIHIVGLEAETARSPSRPLIEGKVPSPPKIAPAIEATPLMVTVAVISPSRVASISNIAVTLAISFSASKRGQSSSKPSSWLFKPGVEVDYLLGAFPLITLSP